MSQFWNRKRILVTGGAGFIGSEVVRNLVEKRGVPRENIVVPRSADCDLRSMEHAQRAVAGCQLVIHTAARTGGIAYSREHPASQYFDCMLMNLNVMAACTNRVEKFVGVGNILAYPETAADAVENSRKVQDLRAGLQEKGVQCLVGG